MPITAPSWLQDPTTPQAPGQPSPTLGPQPQRRLAPPPWLGGTQTAGSLALQPVVGNVAPSKGLLPTVEGLIGNVGRMAYVPIHTGLTWLGKPAEWTENALTQGTGYDAWLANAGFKNPTARGVMSVGLRLALDPTNLFMAPGTIAKGVGLGVKVGEIAMKTAEASGLTRPVVRAAGMLEHALTEGTWTGPVVGRAINLVNRRAEGARQIFDRTAGLPKEVGQALREWHAGTVDASRSALTLKHDLIDRIPVDADAKALAHALEWVSRDAPSELPRHLDAELQNLIKVSDDLTQRAVKGGYIDHAIENYVRHLYPEEDIAAKISASLKGRPLPESGPGSALGRQILPGPKPLGTTIKASNRRMFATIQDAIDAGKHPIEDVRTLVSAHALEIGLAENNTKFLKTLGGLGDAWVQTVDKAPEGWTKIRDLVGRPTAARLGMENLELHPKLADFVRDLITRAPTRGLIGNFGRATGALKQLIFFNPMFHAANVWRSAFLAEGPRVFTPTYFKEWRSAVKDAYQSGPLFRDFLASGGSISSSSSRELRSTLDEILGSGAAAETLGRTGVRWKDTLNPGKLVGSLRHWSDEVLWNQIDRGTRLVAYKHFVDQGITKPTAARMATLFMNDYSRESLTASEKQLAQVFFTYAWNKGRLRLFGNMARGFLPEGLSGLDAQSARLLRSASVRWTAAHVIMPHIVRAMLGRPSAGLYGASIPAGTTTTASGIEKPIYVKPTGFFNDAVDFLKDPPEFARARINPLLRTVIDMAAAADQSRKQGGTATEGMIGALGQEIPSYLPAGVPQVMQRATDVLRPGTPAQRTGRAARTVAPLVGVPVTTQPPLTEDPMAQFHDAVLSGDLRTAAAIASENHLGIMRLAQQLPFEQRRQLLKMYNLMRPHVSTR